MEPFVSLNAKLAPLNRVNVDTDQIIPKQFEKSDVCDLVELLIDERASSLSGQILNIGGV